MNTQGGRKEPFFFLIRWRKSKKKASYIYWSGWGYCLGGVLLTETGCGEAPPLPRMRVSSTPILPVSVARSNLPTMRTIRPGGISRG